MYVRLVRSVIPVQTRIVLAINELSIENLTALVGDLGFSPLPEFGYCLTGNPCLPLQWTGYCCLREELDLRDNRNPRTQVGTSFWGGC